jgi:glycosyltransferase involved in cell wall biosynthesis
MPGVALGLREARSTSGWRNYLMRRVRIASVIANLGFGGSEKRLLSFASTIDKSRFDHVVITLYRPDERNSERAGSQRQAFLDAGIELIHLGEEPRQRIRASWRSGSLVRAASTMGRLMRRLCRVIRNRRIDLIDAQHATAGLLGVLAGRLTGRPATITEYFPGYFDRLGMRLTGQAVFALADAFICDSKAQSDTINRWLFRPHPRSVVIPNGIPVPLVSRTNADMRRELGIPPDRSVRVIGQVSRLIWYKGQRVLLKAARQVISQVPGTYFVMTGYAAEQPEYVEILKQDAQELGIAHWVRIVNWPGSIGDIWELLDIHVHASFQDSLPIAITEGMAFGKPAVVTRVGGVEEMVAQEVTGLVVPVNDPGALADGIVRLLQEPETARRLGAAARQRYLQGYGPEVMTRALEDLFLQMLDGKRALRNELAAV